MKCQNESCNNLLKPTKRADVKYCGFDCAKEQDKRIAHRRRHLNAAKAEVYDKIKEMVDDINRVGVDKIVKDMMAQPLIVPPFTKYKGKGK